MKIGIDASRAFIKNRTGIEEYAYRVINDLCGVLTEEKVFLYLRNNQEVDFVLPANWQVKKLWSPRLWTQLRLSLELLVHRVDVLFVPAHTVPFIHPKKTIVVIHGLEYEFCRESYSFCQRFYMHLSIKWSCRWASDIVCVSKNTKDDVINMYGVAKEKISVIYEGYNINFQISNLLLQAYPRDKSQTIPNDQFSVLNTKYDILNTKYILFVGRIEERKNISRIIEAFEYIKDKYGIAHKLVLAGKPGYAYEKIAAKIKGSKFSEDIVELGYVSEEQKWELLKKADVFAFPTLYEGFGIPILEAQSMMVPVVASNNSSIPEVAGEGALLVDPNDFTQIGENINIAISDAMAREDLVRKGYENVKRFSWAQCAREIANILR